MSDDANTFAEALDAAARGDAPGDDPWSEIANRVLKARGRALEARCPQSVARRAESLFRERPRGVRLLALVFDSHQAAAPAAARGAPEARRMRFQAPEAGLELRVERLEDGSSRIDMALTPAGATELRYIIPPAQRMRRVDLDATGVGSARLGRRAREIVFVALQGGVEVFRTARVHLRVD